MQRHLSNDLKLTSPLTPQQCEWQRPSHASTSVLLHLRHCGFSIWGASSSANSSSPLQHLQTFPKEKSCSEHGSVPSQPKATRLWGQSTLSDFFLAPRLLQVKRSSQDLTTRITIQPDASCHLCRSVTNWSLLCYLGRNTYLCCLPQIYALLKDNSERPSTNDKIHFFLPLPCIIIHQSKNVWFLQSACLGKC